MQHDFSEAHDRHIFRANDALHTGGSHARPAQSEELGSFALCSEAVLERTSQLCPVELAAGFARRDEDGWGHG
jgi:hypothetical protein